MRFQPAEPEDQTEEIIGELPVKESPLDPETLSDDEDEDEDDEEFEDDEDEDEKDEV